MNTQRFKDCLALLGLSQTASCSVIGKSRRAINGYANGKQIPETVANLLESQVKLLETQEMCLNAQKVALGLLQEKADSFPGPNQPN
jgi:hypothetical protein